MKAILTIILWSWLATVSGLAQTNDAARAVELLPGATSALTNRVNYFQVGEAMRTNCIQGRRIICGRIVKVLPGGLVVDSGYTNLMRHPLERSWLISGTVKAEREPNLVEKNEPDCPCVGLVYLTDTPKSRRIKPKVFDYVVLEAFPAGHFTYNSVGTIQRTVRRFSVSLPVAVRINLNDEQK